VTAERDRRRVVLLVMCAGHFLVLLDTTIVNVALPSIASDLGASVDGLQWVVDTYLIAVAALMLAGGTVVDLFGHKRVLRGRSASGRAWAASRCPPGRWWVACSSRAWDGVRSSS
jgi:DHA2 family methylenomycin A resistance protein-like MFS transporter